MTAGAPDGGRTLLDGLRGIHRGFARTIRVLGGLTLGFLAASLLVAIQLNPPGEPPHVGDRYTTGISLGFFLFGEFAAVLVVCLGLYFARIGEDRLDDLAETDDPGGERSTPQGRATRFLDRSGRWTAELGRIQAMIVAAAALLTLLFAVVVVSNPIVPPLTGRAWTALAFFEFLGLPLGVASYAAIEILDAWRSGVRWSRRLAEIRRRAAGAGEYSSTAEPRSGEAGEATLGAMLERTEAARRRAAARFRIAALAGASVLTILSFATLDLVALFPSRDRYIYAYPTFDGVLALGLGALGLGLGLLVLAGLAVRARVAGARGSSRPRSSSEGLSASEALAEFAGASDGLVRLRQLGRSTGAALGWSLAWLLGWSLLWAPEVVQLGGSWTGPVVGLEFVSVLVVTFLLVEWIRTGPEIRRVERGLSRVAGGIGRVESEFWERY